MTFPKFLYDCVAERSEGVFRVENTFIVLDFSDQEVLNAVLRFAGDEDIPTGIVFNGKIFAMENENELISYRPIDTYIPPDPPPPPPPCCWCDPPPPPPPCYDCEPVYPVGGGSSSSNQTSAPPPERNHRDTGPTRGDSGSNVPETGSRPGGRRP